MHSFKGFMKLSKDPKNEPATIENLILRGSLIRNCEWVVALIIYAGADTKIMMNSFFGRKKLSPLHYHVDELCVMTGLLITLMALVIKSYSKRIDVM
jgi:phospholipid-translocating ATPase